MYVHDDTNCFSLSLSLSLTHTHTHTHTHPSLIQSLTHTHTSFTHSLTHTQLGAAGSEYFLDDTTSPIEVGQPARLAEAARQPHT